MPVFTSDDHPLAAVVLRDFVDKTLINRYEELSTSDLWIPCANRIKYIDRFKQMAFFDHLYVERLAQKTVVFQQWLDQTANDWENVLFLALAKGFGLSVNGLAFAAVAQSIPFSVIRKTTDHEELEALLFGQAEILKAEIDDAYLEKLQKIYRYLQHKLQLKNVKEKVKFFRMRPRGFPTIRLSQLAQLYVRHSQLLDKIVEGDAQKNVEEVFRVGTSDYWSTQHVFGKSHAKQNKVLTKSLLDLLIINTLIPFLFCYYKAHGINKTDELISWASSIQAEMNSTIRAFSSLGVHATSALDVRPYSSSRASIANIKGVFLAHLGKSSSKLDIFVNMRVAHRIRHQLERHGFEVCSRLADRLGMRARPVRLFFIYISFFSLGIGFAVYLILAFWLRLKDLVYAKRTSVFDL